MRFFVHALPARILSSNGAQGQSEGHRRVENAARKLLLDEAMNSIMVTYHGQEVPRYGSARVSIVLHTTNKKPKDGLYRPKDSWNLVYAIKAIPDAIVMMGITEDDDWEHQVIGSISRQKVERLEDEGIEVLVEPL